MPTNPTHSAPVEAPSPRAEEGRILKTNIGTTYNSLSDILDEDYATQTQSTTHTQIVA
jgi:hypothetical protein